MAGEGVGEGGGGEGVGEGGGGAGEKPHTSALV